VQELDDMFSRYGRVTEIRIVRDPMNGRCKGFGFIAMSSDREVSAVSWL
jgi:RNA recognition motif-containing protein